MALLNSITEGLSGLLGSATKELIPFSDEANMNIQKTMADTSNDAAFGNSWAKQAWSYASYLANSPNQILQRTDLESAKNLSVFLGGFSNTLEKNVEGIATAPDLANYHTTISAQDKLNFNNALQDAFSIHLKDGGDNNYQIFTNDAMDTLLSGNKSDSDAVNSAANSLKSYFSSLPDNGTGGVPKALDWNNIYKSGDDFANFIRSKLGPDATTADVYSKINDLKKSGVFTDLNDYGIQASDSELRPYLSDNYHDIVEQHINQTALDKSFMNVPEIAPMIQGGMSARQAVTNYIQKDMTDRVNELDAIREQHVQAIQSTGQDASGVNKIYQDKINSLIQDGSRTAAIANNLLDVYTGNADARSGVFGSSTVKKMSRTLRTLTYLRQMGSNALGILPHAGRVFAYKLYDKVQLPELAKSADYMLKLSPEERGIMAHHTQSILDDGRAANIFDIGADIKDDYSNSGIGKATDTGLSWLQKTMTKYNGVGWLNKLEGNIAAHAGLATNLARAKALLDGKLEKGSFDSIELARFGIDESNAQRIHDNYMEHRTWDEQSKVWLPNVGDWDHKTATEVGAMLNRYVERIVTEPSKGSNWHWTNTALGKALFQFKRWGFGAYEKIVQEQFQQAGMTPLHSRMMMTNMMSLSAMGALAGTLQDIQSGKNPDITPEYLATKAWDRGGAAAYIDMLTNVADRYGYGMGSLLGQTDVIRNRSTSVLDDVLGADYRFLNTELPDAGAATVRLLTGNSKHGDVNKVVQTMPLKNLIGWNYIYNNGIKQSLT